MVLGCILGTQAESSFMTSMISYQNDWTIFFTRPISGVVMVLVVVALVFPLVRHLRHCYGKRLPASQTGA
jgi:putative tricarboxylic transport membrane protein